MPSQQQMPSQTSVRPDVQTDPNVFDFSEDPAMQQAETIGNAATIEEMNQEAQKSARAWALSIDAQMKIHNTTLTALGAAAQQHLSTADPDGFDSIVTTADEFVAGLSEWDSALGEPMEAEITRFRSQGADSGDLEKLRDMALPQLVSATMAMSDFGSRWVIWEYRGANKTIPMSGYHLDRPPATGESARDAERWQKYLAMSKDRFHGILVEGDETRDFAETLKGKRITALGILEAWDDSPSTNEFGRYREYCDAVLEDLAPEWAEHLNMDSAKVGMQVSAEEAEGRIDWEEMDDEDLDDVEWEGDIDFEELEDGLDTIESEINANWSDDDTIMGALEEADSPAQRDYMLRRLRAEGNYSEMVDELDGSDVDDFEAYRARADVYADDNIGSASGPTIEGAFEDAARMYPGAVASVGSGMVYGIPIVGDVIEKEWGEDINQGIGQLYEDCGVDERSAAMSMAIGQGSGKVATAIGTAAAGGGAANVLKGASTLGTGGKIATTAIAGADILNNGYQAWTGEKITSVYLDDDEVDKISTLERIGAGAGFLGGAADVGGALYSRGAAAAADAAGAADEVVEVADDVVEVADDVVEGADDAVEVADDIVRTEDGDSLDELLELGNNSRRAPEEATETLARSEDDVVISAEEIEQANHVAYVENIRQNNKVSDYTGAANTGFGLGGQGSKTLDAWAKYQEDQDKGAAGMVEQNGNMGVSLLTSLVDFK